PGGPPGHANRGAVGWPTPGVDGADGDDGAAQSPAARRAHRGAGSQERGAGHPPDPAGGHRRKSHHLDGHPLPVGGSPPGGPRPAHAPGPRRLRSAGDPPAAGAGERPAPAVRPAPLGRPAGRVGGGDAAPGLRLAMSVPPRVVDALRGRYEIGRELGHGGMATVYLARDVRDERAVAIKVMHPRVANALNAQRFLREISIAGSMGHPLIVPLHDSGAVEEVLFYVMPY